MINCIDIMEMALINIINCVLLQLPIKTCFNLLDNWDMRVLEIDFLFLFPKLTYHFVEACKIHLHLFRVAFRLLFKCHWVIWLILLSPLMALFVWLIITAKNNSGIWVFLINKILALLHKIMLIGLNLITPPIQSNKIT